jgi:hypothetical protein
MGQSNLPVQVLGQIWDLADLTKDGRFACARVCLRACVRACVRVTVCVRA